MEAKANAHNHTKAGFLEDLESGFFLSKSFGNAFSQGIQIFFRSTRFFRKIIGAQLELYTQKLLKKDIQLKMMFSQLNAHFLYNTLDILCWMGKVRNNPDVAELSMALAQYFRINLSEGRDIVTVREVIALIENYLLIYSIKSDYSVRLDLQIPPRS